MMYATVLKNGVPTGGHAHGMFFGSDLEDLRQNIAHRFGEKMVSYQGAHPTRMFHVDYVGIVPDDMETYREKAEVLGHLSRAAG